MLKRLAQPEWCNRCSEDQPRNVPAKLPSGEQPSAAELAALQLSELCRWQQATRLQVCAWRCIAEGRGRRCSAWACACAWDESWQACRAREHRQAAMLGMLQVRRRSSAPGPEVEIQRMAHVACLEATLHQLQASVVVRFWKNYSIISGVFR